MNESLLPGEKVLATRPANLMFGFEVDAAKLAANHPLLILPKLIPLLAKARSLGGKLHLTTYRLLFETHRLNSTRGTCSVFLPTIIYDEPVTGPFAGQWVVKTRAAGHRFAVRDPKELSQLLRQTQEKPLDAAELRTHVKGNLQKVSEGIGPLVESKDLESVIKEKRANALQLLGVMNAHDLLNP
ncbi:MAG: hypothetical protein JNK82_02385 [Myxococcaceae bacterium]|nr:hypothetical protein [Myxococcaceae bacterium]